MTILVPLEYHSIGTTRQVVAMVEQEGDWGESVRLYLKGEDDGDPGADRTLTPDEARALAAALIHYAERAEA